MAVVAGVLRGLVNIIKALDITGELDIIVLWVWWSADNPFTTSLKHGPCQKTYSKLANFNVVDSKNFFFFRCTKLQDGNEFS
jgi:hypothetical protein